MLTSNREGNGGARVFGARGVIVVTALAGLAIGVARAEDIGVEPNSAPRTSNVRTAPRTAPRKAPTRAAARPTVPRPIQDETTATAASAPAARTPAPRPTYRRGQEQAVNLDALTTPTAAPAATSTAHSSYAAPAAAPAGGGILPNFKFYYDFMLKSWKGSSSESDFTFDSYHQRLMVEFTPTPDLMFGGEILDKKYFETDYMLTSRLQVRWGRIWIPFDDMSPHNTFGGRINTSEFRQGNETAFLPDIWADLGIGFKLTLADSSAVSSELHFYVVNGFQEARGRSPVQGEDSTGTNAAYPSFDGTSGGAGDNNNDKAIGARWHGLFGRRFGLGASVYRDVYTNKGEESRGLLILGTDLQLRPTNTTEIRLGYTTMRVSLDPTASSKDSYMRGGTYAELGQKFGTDNRWKFLLRAGSSQNDNRVVDVSDKTIVGFTLLKNFGSVEPQLTYFRDLHQVPGKIAYNYGEFRIVTVF